MRNAITIKGRCIAENSLRAQVNSKNSCKVKKFVRKSKKQR